MAKSDNGTRRTKQGTTTTEAPSDAMEQRVLAFAEQLGRMIGTIQVKAEGWMDRATLNPQIARVRDGATELLEHLADAVTTAATKASTKPSKKKSPTAAGSRPGTTRAGTTGRSGGAVDAPGKKRRKPAATDPDATIAASQAAKMRAAKTMEKTSKRRGRA